MKSLFKASAWLLLLLFTLGAFACGKPAAIESDEAVIASIGEQSITLGLFKSAFTSYADYYDQLGMDPFSSQSELERFQDMVLEAVVNDALVLHHASRSGFNLSAEDREGAEKTAAEELDEIKRQLMSQAEQMHQKDGSKTIEQYFDEQVREVSEYYTGTPMSFDDYSKEYVKQYLDTALVSAYQDEFEASLSVSDAEISEWFEKQYASDEKLYSENPAQYLKNATEFELYGSTSAEAYPPLCIPQGYSRVFDIVVYPDGELGDEYRSIQAQMSDVSAQCSEMLFSDALSGINEHENEIAELISAYKTLEKQSAELYDAFQASARKKIDEAYVLLLDGESFIEVMKRYSEASYPEFAEGSIPKSVLEKGELISLSYDCGSDDRSTTFKDIFGMTAKGAFSAVFSDEDGSLHIIMHGDDEPAGRVDIGSVRDAIVRIIRSEKSSTEWQSMLAEWREDPELYIDMPAIRKVGEDRLADKNGE